MIHTDGTPTIANAPASKGDAVTRPTIAIPANHDLDTITAAIVEIDSHMDYEAQSGRLDDRTEEAIVIALEVLQAVQFAYGELEGR